jgi:hypothetical protein
MYSNHDISASLVAVIQAATAPGMSSHGRRMGLLGRDDLDPVRTVGSATFTHARLICRLRPGLCFSVGTDRTRTQVSAGMVGRAVRFWLINGDAGQVVVGARCGAFLPGPLGRFIRRPRTGRAVTPLANARYSAQIRHVARPPVWPVRNRPDLALYSPQARGVSWAAGARALGWARRQARAGLRRVRWPPRRQR